MPNGVWETTDYIDVDPVKGEGMIPIRVKMTIDGDHVHYDLSGSHPTTISTFLNCCYGGAFAAIARLAEVFDGAVWLVSKCGPRVQAKTRRWLDHWKFWTATGVAPDHLRFCLERRDKALHCHELGVTHFIDDRLDVLTHLRGFVARLYLFGHQNAPAPGWVTPVVTWPAVLEAVLPALECSAEAPPR
jgi:hypothetical protein